MIDSRKKGLERLGGSRVLTCPHCGKEGMLAFKTLIVKRKYKYRKMYVYHRAYGEKILYTK
jgi:hypothetical protein